MLPRIGNGLFLRLICATESNSTHTVIFEVFVQRPSELHTGPVIPSAYKRRRFYYFLLLNGVPFQLCTLSANSA